MLNHGCIGKPKVLIKEVKVGLIAPALYKIQLIEAI
jgi:hypothetical protein